MALRFGVKAYSYDWHIRQGLDYGDAARWLRRHGFDFIISLNQHVPMADNAIASSHGADSAIALPNDREWVAALHEQGVEYWAACNVFFDPLALERHQGAIPVDGNGRHAESIGWYRGVCPTHAAYLEEKLAQIAEAAKSLDVDGIHLGFMRFPGFWELRTKGTAMSEQSEYCFCSRCCMKFAKYSDRRIPTSLQSQPWTWVTQEEIYPEYILWKKEIITAIVARIREMLNLNRAQIPIMLNTLPFSPATGSEAEMLSYGQDMQRLSPHVDIFEVMTYHQILAHEAPWIEQTLDYFRTRTTQTIVATIQVAPRYIDDAYSGQDRNQTIDGSEFKDAIEFAQRGGAERVVLFTLDDLLDDNSQLVQEKLEIIREIRMRTHAN